jgi:hypothetical protein
MNELDPLWFYVTGAVKALAVFTVLLVAVA